MQRYFVDENAFNRLTPATAYVLGFIYADGNVFTRKRGGSVEYRLTIANIDKPLLNQIRTVLRSAHPLGKFKSGVNTCYHLTIGNRPLVESLISLGVTPRKSKTIQWPNLAPDLVPHFVRGYFDGDGWAVTPQAGGRALSIGFVSGSQTFLVRLSRELSGITRFTNSRGKLTGQVEHQSNDSGAAYTLRYTGQDAGAICALMYAHAGDLYMRRKRERYDIWLAAMTESVQWGENDLETMRQCYATTATEELATRLGKSVESILSQARRMRITKSKRGCAVCGKPGHVRTTCPIAGNMPDGRELESHPKQKQKPAAKLTWRKVRAIRRKWAKGNMTGHELANLYQLTPGAISMIVNNKSWHDPTWKNPRTRYSSKPRATLTKSKVNAIRRDYAGGVETMRTIGKRYGVSAAQISRIIRGERWRDS